jgi:hypothetical protein
MKSQFPWGFELESRVEWEVFTLMTFLKLSLQWMWSYNCSDEDFIRITGSFEVFLTDEMQNEETGLVT